MKPLLLILSLACLSHSAVAGATKIARLVAKLHKDPLWMSGTFPELGLPRSATTAQVVARCLEMIRFDPGHIKRYEIRAIEKVPWQNLGEITFVRITSDLGDKIIAMQYKDTTRWWTKIFP